MEVEGCKLHDVGWMKISPDGLMPTFYGYAIGSSYWDVAYVRPSDGVAFECVINGNASHKVQHELVNGDATSLVHRMRSQADVSLLATYYNFAFSALLKYNFTSTP